ARRGSRRSKGFTQGRKENSRRSKNRLADGTTKDPAMTAMKTFEGNPPAPVVQEVPPGHSLRWDGARMRIISSRPDQPVPQPRVGRKQWMPVPTPDQWVVNTRWLAPTVVDSFEA